jgi:hypothetical protein
VSIVVEPWRVVVVTVYVPAHAFFPIGNGKVIEFDAPDLIVNGGVVNRTELALLQFFPIGPDTENCTFTFCGALMQSITLAVIPTSAGRVTVEGLIPTAA